MEEKYLVDKLIDKSAYLENYVEASDMIRRWLTDGEVFGTDHYIGPEYNLEEYKNLVFIFRMLQEEIRRGLSYKIRKGYKL